MVYIGRDGTISQREPWNVRIWRMIVGFFQAIYFFFVTLFGDLIPKDNKSSGNSGRRPGGGGSGFGPSGGGGGRGQPAGFSRRIGRVVNADDCPMPGGG